MLKFIDYFKDKLYKDEKQKSIHNIPDHILVKIIHQLQFNDVLQVTQVSHLFNKLVTEESSKLKVVLDLGKADDCFELSRSYRSVEIKNIRNGSCDRAVSLIQSSNPNVVKEIHFNNCILGYKVLVDVLKSCPILRSLSFANCEIEGTNDSYDLPVLECLKRLCIGKDSWIEIVEILQNVTSLKAFFFKYPVEIKEEEQYEDEDEGEYEEGSEDDIKKDFQAVKNFLLRQKNLKLLEIRNGNFFKENFQPENIQLVELNLFIPELTRRQMENMLAFISTQRTISDCLFNILPYAQADDMMKSLYHILAQSSLRNLSLVFYEECEMTRHVIAQKAKNLNVETLQLKPCYMDRSLVKPFTKQIADTFPNIKMLDLDLAYNSFKPSTMTPLSSLKNLETFRLSGCKSFHLMTVNIPNLKEIKICGLVKSRMSDWTTFVGKHPNLISVDVQLCMDNRVKLAHDLAALFLNNLKHLAGMHICTLNVLVTPEETKSIDDMIKKHPTMTLPAFNFCGRAPYEVEKKVSSWKAIEYMKKNGNIDRKKSSLIIGAAAGGLLFCLAGGLL